MPSFHDAYIQIQAQYHAENALMREALLMLTLPMMQRDTGVEILLDNETIVFIHQDGLCSVCDPDEDDLPSFGDDAVSACVHVLAATLYLAMQPKGAEIDATPGAAPANVEQILRHLEPMTIHVEAWNTHGLKWSMAIRNHDIDKAFLDAQHVAKQIKAFGWMSNDAYQLYKSTKGKAPAPEEHTDEPATVPQAPASHAHTQPPQQPAQAPAHGVKTFHATHFVTSYANNRWYWRVMGSDIPRYNAKYGMNCWDEGLQASGFDPEALDPQHPPVIQGWIAEYVMKGDSGQEKPDKVIALRKA